MTVYEMMQNMETGFDISDETYDTGIYLDYIEETTDNDYYDKFIIYLAKNTELVKFQPNWFSICKISEFVNEHLDVFTDFFNKNNRLGYRPKDFVGECEFGQEFYYEAYLCGLESLIAGNYSESDYKTLYNKLKK